jgi:glycosyltransferase involved in cell wall biosynthesis
LYLAKKISFSNVPLIYREAIAPLEQIQTYKKLKYYFAKMAYPISYRRAQILVAQTERIKMELKNNFNVSNKIVVIPNGIDFKLSNDKIPSEIDEWVNSNLKIVLNVGRLSKQKDHLSLIKAFSYVIDKEPSARLVIVGSGNEKDNIMDEINKYDLNDVIRLVGYKSDPSPFYHYASVFVLSSIFEGFPNVLVEALASGLPVVSTDCKTGPKEILGNNNYGLLVPIKDSIKMANAVIQQISKPYPSYETRKKRSQYFNINTMVNSYSQLIHYKDEVY